MPPYPVSMAIPPLRSISVFGGIVPEILEFNFYFIKTIPPTFYQVKPGGVKEHWENTPQMQFNVQPRTSLGMWSTRPSSQRRPFLFLFLLFFKTYVEEYSSFTFPFFLFCVFFFVVCVCESTFRILLFFYKKSANKTPKIKCERLSPWKTPWCT